MIHQNFFSGVWPKWFFAVMLLLGGCASEHPIELTFFDQGYDQMGSRFETYSLPDQIKIYLYGVQNVQPPVTVLSRQIAEHGALAVPHILNQLALQPTDQNVKDLVVVFETMQRIGAYRVKHDKVLLKTLDSYVNGMTNPVWRGYAKDNMVRIRNSEVGEELDH